MYVNRGYTTMIIFGTIYTYNTININPGLMLSLNLKKMHCGSTLCKINQ